MQRVLFLIWLAVFELVNPALAAQMRPDKSARANDIDSLAPDAMLCIYPGKKLEFSVTACNRLLLGETGFSGRDRATFLHHRSIIRHNMRDLDGAIADAEEAAKFGGNSGRLKHKGAGYELQRTGISTRLTGFALARASELA